MKNKIICGFPGVGKSYVAKNKNITDSDSSTFSKESFPDNYINHLTKQKGVVLASTHKEVREGLKKRGVEFLVVVPDISLKQEYLERYRKRGSDEKFIKLLNENFEKWVKDSMKEDKVVVLLKKNQYLSDILN